MHLTLKRRHARLAEVEEGFATAGEKRMSLRLGRLACHVLIGYSSLSPFGRWSQKIVSQPGASTYECQVNMMSRLRNLLFFVLRSCSTLFVFGPSQFTESFKPFKIDHLRS